MIKNLWTYWDSFSGKSTSVDQKELISLVGTAYKGTTLGSFVNSVDDVKRSNWKLLDFDKDPDIDCAIFFRLPTQNELWEGRNGSSGFGKVQGIGHDGSREAKDKVIQYLVRLLQQPGWWIESSDAMSKALSRSLKPVNDPFTIRVLFRDNNIHVVNGVYSRKTNSKTVTESVFGKPKLSSKADKYKL